MGLLKAMTRIRPPKEDLREVMDANFNASRLVGDEMADISTLFGGVSRYHGEKRRVEELARQIADDENGYFERLIVDDAGDVVEGQHRLDALRQLGVTEVPIVRIKDLMRGFNEGEIGLAMQKAGMLHPDHESGLIRELGRALADEGSVAAIRANVYAPRGYEKFWEAGLSAMERGQK